MTINVRQAQPAQPIRPPVLADALAGRRAPGGGDDAGTPAKTTELPQAGRPGQAVDVRNQAAVQGADLPPDPPELARAVEDANAVAESIFRATNRKVTFGRDENSGRVVIKVREERGEEVEVRQIPPQQFLRLLERLRTAREGGSLSGAFVDLDG
jgi:uncharacterized FlaG/YvyC family protein